MKVQYVSLQSRSQPQLSELYPGGENIPETAGIGIVELESQIGLINDAKCIGHSAGDRSKVLQDWGVGDWFSILKI